MEVVIRFNDDYENDYIFTIQETHTVKNYLDKMFEPKSVLANLIPLRPSIFYDRKPTKFYKSVCPGTLTYGGSIIANFDATKKEYLEELDPNKPLIEQLWPEQLIVPHWEVRKENVRYYIFFCLIWLYTDLPDFISPTPGHCLSNYISLALLPIVERVADPWFAEKLRAEIQPNSIGKIAQLIFFGIHILKIAVMTLFFGLGMANPLSFNPLVLKKARDMTANDPRIKDKLRILGWLGLKRATYTVYKKEFKAFMMKKYGGFIGAHKAGVLKRVANPGTKLDDGEGYATPIANRNQDTFEIMETENKFVLSNKYFAELKREMDNRIALCNGDVEKINVLVKNFRRFGLFEGEKLIKDVVSKKEELSGKYAYLDAFKNSEVKKEK